MTNKLKVRVNPKDHDEFAVRVTDREGSGDDYFNPNADELYSGQEVADWPELELEIPEPPAPTFRPGDVLEILASGTRYVRNGCGLWLNTRRDYDTLTVEDKDVARDIKNEQARLVGNVKDVGKIAFTMDSSQVTRLENELIGRDERIRDLEDQLRYWDNTAAEAQQKYRDLYADVREVETKLPYSPENALTARKLREILDAA